MNGLEIMKNKQPKRKGLSPALWGIGAAVLIFALLAAVLILRSCRQEEESFTLPPMVYAEDTRWLFERDITAEADSLKEEMRYLGEITSVLAETEYVGENFQANFPALGDKIYRWQEYLVLYHGEEIWLMRPMTDVQTQVFPAAS